MDWFPESSIIFETVWGSQLYGTATEKSDQHFRGVVIPPITVLLDPFHPFDFHETEDPDRVLYSLRDFMSQVGQGYMYLIELLYAPQDKWRYVDESWLAVLENRSKFLSRRIAGKAFSMVRGDMQYLTRRFLDIKSGEQVQENEKLMGYDTGIASHMLRMISQTKELLKDGKITYPRPDAGELLSVKRGYYTLQVFEDVVLDRLHEVELLLDSTRLPAYVDWDCLKELYMALIFS